MKSNLLSQLHRFLIALAIFAICAAALPQSAEAASPFITITAVKAGESVTVHATGLPAGKTFTARMGPADTHAVDGTAVGETQSGSDGTFDATYAIPAALQQNGTIAIRIDALGGWYAYNWFTNQTKGTTPAATPVPATPSTSTDSSAKLSIQVSAVEKNKAITVRASSFPANTNFTVRVGPYATFSKQQVTTGTINSGNGGSFEFKVELPGIVKDVALVTVRLDSYTSAGHLYAYNAFTNVSGGTTGGSPSTATPTTTQTPAAPTSTPVAQAACQIVSVSPSQPVATNWDFDAVWEVKNTGSQIWDAAVVDLRYQGGTELYQTAKIYDLPQRVKPGETVTLRADLVAPSKAGTYTTRYMLSGDHGSFCTLPLTLTVK